MAYEADLIQVWNAIAPLIKGTPQREQHKAALAASGAQTEYTQALRQRMETMTPAEIAQITAQTGFTGAQTASTQGTERRAEAAFPWEQALRAIETQYRPQQNQVALELGRAQTGEAQGRGALYGAEATATPQRVQLEREGQEQRGKLGTRELDLREQGQWGDVLQSATMMYPPQNDLVAQVRERLGVPQQLGAGMEQEPTLDARVIAEVEKRFKDLGIGANERPPQLTPAQSAVTPIGPGAPMVSTGAYPGGMPRTQGQTQRPQPQPQRNRVTYEHPNRNTPIGMGAPGVVGEDRTLMEAIEVIRNIMAHGGVR